MTMKFIPTSLKDVILIEPNVFGDARGFFMETFRSDEFAASGIPTTFVQDNHSGSRLGILRGLHYQLRYPQGKLVRVIAGEIFDVVVDIRFAQRKLVRRPEHLSQGARMLDNKSEPRICAGVGIYCRIIPETDSEIPRMVIAQ